MPRLAKEVSETGLRRLLADSKREKTKVVTLGNPRGFCVRLNPGKQSSAACYFTYRMAKGEPFAACYWDTPAGRVFSLRSTDDGVVVSAVAKKYGGGGHRNAAGFRVPI